MDTASNKMSIPVIDDETGDTFHIPLSMEEYEKALADESFMLKIISERAPQRKSANKSTTEGEGSHQQPQKNPQEMVNSDDCADSWTPAGTLFFISEFESFQELIEKGKLKQKDAFEKIASNLKKKSIHVSAKQCATKLASLKRMYKKIKDHNSKSGNDRQKWQYFERMDNIYSKKPWIEPVATCSSETAEDETKENSEPQSARQPKRRRTRSSVEDKFDKYIEEVTKRREDHAAQHVERMQRMDRLLEILEKNAKNG